MLIQALSGDGDNCPVEEPGAALPPPGTAGLPFMGRTRELALAERHLRGAGPPLLLLAGEPGIGTTRLLRAGL